MAYLGPSTSKILQDNKKAQHEQLYLSQSNLSESPSQVLTTAKQSSSSPSGRHSPDLHDVVKDSMYREVHSLSVKTVAKTEGRVHVMKHIDSPRPPQQSNCGKLSSGTAQVPAKLRVAPWNSEEDKVCFLHRAPKDRPRFSCDGRESTETMQSMMKLKDLPRLSLDSRRQSLRSTASESRSGFLLRDQELQCHNRSSSIVAKLMGLDAFPNAVPSKENEIVTPKNSPAKDSILISTKSAGKGKINQVTTSPEMLENDFASPQRKSTNTIARPPSTSTLPLESAPSRQPEPEANQASTKSSFRCNDKEASPQSPHLSSSAYGEIERRITELDFRRPGTDFRALKQILGALQKTRERLEGKRAQGASDTKWQQAQQRQQRSPLSLATKVTQPSKRSECSNLTPKPPRLGAKIRFASTEAPTVNVAKPQEVYTQDLEQTSNANNVAGSGQHLPSPDKKTKGRTSRAVQTTSRQQSEGSFSLAIGKSNGTLSPRLQQKQQGIDKQACQTTPSTETSKVRRQSVIEFKNSKSNQKAKPRNMQLASDLNDTSTYKRNFSKHGDAVPVLSEINNSSASYAEASTDSYFQINAKRQEHSKKRGDTSRPGEDTLIELPIAAVEQLSPVSVLDATFYVEDSPSPVKKKILTAFRDDEFVGTDAWYRGGLDLGVNSNHTILESKENMVHELRKLTSTIHEANMDQLASLCQNQNPDNGYITKILLASGLLKDVDSISAAIQLHSSSHLINPKLFHMLEQTEQNSVLANA